MVAVAQRTRLARKAAGMAAFRRRTRIRGDNILCWGLLALLAVLVIYPLISLVYGSFDATGPDGETATFSLENFSRLLSDPQFYLAWQHSRPDERRCGYVCVRQWQ